ncbi:MAG: preprotein translocase subunit SecY [Candidatus Dormibacteria bacterium]
MLEAIANAFRVPELRRKILFTGGVLLVFRLFAHIAIPGANTAALQNLFQQNNLLGLLDLFSGGGLSTFSIIAMGVNPYINATIIMQLMTVVSERIKEMSKEGEQGRKRITQYTRRLTVGLGALQAFGLTQLFRSQQAGSILDAAHSDVLHIIVIIVTLSAGTIMLMWFGELITEYGIGNGISLVIFAGIVGRLPVSIGRTVGTQTPGLASLAPLVVFAVLALLVTMFIIFVQQATRKIPIQSAQRISSARSLGGVRTSHLPLRVNQAGVIPIIFAISIMIFPSIITQFFANFPTSSLPYQSYLFVQKYLNPNSSILVAQILYNGLYFLLIVGFTYFYTAVTFDPVDTADNLKKYSSFVPGIRPGRPTAEYLDRVMTRITFAGALFLGIITVLVPIIASLVTGVDRNTMYLGGTAVLIVVGVALDTMKQIETQLIMRQYRGFIK